MNAHTPTWMQHLREKRDAWYVSRVRRDERFDALRTLPVRRGLVIASFLLLLSAAVLLWWGFESAFLIPGLFTLGGGLLLARAVRLVVDAPDQAHDERLVAIRNAAYRTSYRIFAVVAALATFVVSFMLDERLGWLAFDLEGHHVRALLFGLVGLAVLLPTTVLAWREREV